MQMEKGETAQASRPLEGEDLQTTHWEDARHWIGVYDDLLKFKLVLLDRVRRELPKMLPVAQKAAADDNTIIERQMEGYQQRLDLWYRHVWDLQGLWLDPKGSVIRHEGQEAALTGREFQLLGFLLGHPHRFFNAEQIGGQAWTDPDISPEQVRTYVLRIRRILARLKVPYEVVNRPGLGYSLVFSRRVAPAGEEEASGLPRLAGARSRR
jgi:DNA-binding winged helix-turn-helix (wHTH) protein